MADRQEDTAKKGSFFSNMVAELKKVVWPTGAQTAKGTGTVILFVLIVTAILVILNLAFETINQKYWEAVNPNKVEPVVTEQVDSSTDSTENLDEATDTADTEVTDTTSTETTEVSE